jgi:hypothetical protein
MTQYLISMYQPDGIVPPKEVLDQVMADLGVINDDIRAAGGWVFTGGLHPTSTATVLSYQNGDVLMTDGPFIEGKEHLGGFWIVEAPDLDAALGWARRIVGVTRLPLEVRPFRDRLPE